MESRRKLSSNSAFSGVRGSAAFRLALSLLAVVAVFTLLSIGVLFQGRTDGLVTDVIIPRGSSLAKVSDILSERGIVAQPRLFKVILRLTGGAGRVRAGEFRFRQGMRAIDALTVLYHDEPIVYHITIPEGFTIQQMGVLLAAQQLVNAARFRDLAMTKGAAKRFGIPGDPPSLEGFLYPDTYDFSKIDGEEKVLERMVQRFMQVYEKELRTQMAGKRMSLVELVTFASIVEKETGNPSERELVASVFHNRLQKRMRLQSDPTTIYGIPNFNGNLTKADLLRYTPYNTYTIYGLPPGPIASPGLAAMKAVLNPAQTNYLYFVANKKGGHVFSETYSQHARYVNALQK